MSQILDHKKSDLDSDPYLLQLHEKLTEAIKERKLLEGQSKQLENRIKFLKSEESKSIKDVESIKIKYQKKYSSMQQIEEDLKDKLEQKAFYEKELEKQKEFNKTMKTEITEKIKQKRNEYLQRLQSEMKGLKKLKRKNEDMQKFIKIEEHTTNKNKYEFIRNQKLLSDEKKKAICIDRKNKTKENLEKKIMSEKEKKDKVENSIKEMGNEEVDILKRIKTTTQIHEKWTKELEMIDKRKTELSESLRKVRNKQAYSHKYSASYDGKINEEILHEKKEEEREANSNSKSKFRIPSQTFNSPKRELLKTKISEIKEQEGDSDEEKEKDFFKGVRIGNQYDAIGQSLKGNNDKESKTLQILDKIRAQRVKTNTEVINA